MRPLTSLDTQFLALESPRQAGHVAGLAILDHTTTPTGTLDVEDIKNLITERLLLLPPLRWKLTEYPLNLDYPFWIDDPDFDLDYHVREVALPKPGSDAQLAAQVTRITSRPLDRTRPLWEIYLIHGLASGYTAMLTKIHHAVIDGISGAEIMGLLLDLEPTGRKLPKHSWDGSAGDAPGQTELYARAALGVPKYPIRVLKALPTTLPNISDVPAIFGGIPGAQTVGNIADRAQRLVRRDLPPVDKTSLTAPSTPFNGRISAHRRLAFGDLSLEDVKEVKNLHGATVNDVVVSICAGAVRRWLVDHDALPEDPLVAQIPVSVRTDEEAGTYGNKIMLMAAPLYTDEADPIARLKKTHEAMIGMKERHRALPAALMQNANDFVPPAVFARAAQLTFRIATGTGRPNWNLVISNVPGPPVPLYCAGARLEANYPISVITDGMGLNITVMSYCGNMNFGIVADRDQMPDVDKLMRWLKAELDALRPNPKPPAKAKAKAKAPANAPAKKAATG